MPCRQPAWFSRVVEGSVIAERSGTWRIVRKVHRSPNGKLWGVTLVIRRCSWTKRCYTVLNYQDLLQRGFRLINVPPRALRGRVDREIAKVIRTGSRALSCCDVEGVA
jgi:hypothetical protein